MNHDGKRARNGHDGCKPAAPKKRVPSGDERSEAWGSGAMASKRACTVVHPGVRPKTTDGGSRRARPKRRVPEKKQASVGHSESKTNRGRDTKSLFEPSPVMRLDAGDSFGSNGAGALTLEGREDVAGPAHCGDSGHKEEGRGIRVLSRITERLRGLKGVKGEDECAVLVPCRDIHTFGMSGPIDAAFIDAAGSVVAVHRRVMPGRRIRHADARMVVERPFQTGKWLECGDGFFNVAPRG